MCYLIQANIDLEKWIVEKCPFRMKRKSPKNRRPLAPGGQTSAMTVMKGSIWSV